jgi:hypothetical protein
MKEVQPMTDPDDTKQPDQADLDKLTDDGNPNNPEE